MAFIIPTRMEQLGSYYSITLFECERKHYWQSSYELCPGQRSPHTTQQTPNQTKINSAHTDGQKNTENQKFTYTHL